MGYDQVHKKISFSKSLRLGKKKDFSSKAIEAEAAALEKSVHFRVDLITELDFSFFNSTLFYVWPPFFIQITSHGKLEYS